MSPFEPDPTPVHVPFTAHAVLPILPGADEVAIDTALEGSKDASGPLSLLGHEQGTEHESPPPVNGSFDVGRARSHPVPVHPLSTHPERHAFSTAEVTVSTAF